MGESAPFKSGRMVVRYHAPWRRRGTLIGMVVGAIVLIYGTYEWGRFDGGYSGPDHTLGQLAPVARGAIGLRQIVARRVVRLSGRSSGDEEYPYEVEYERSLHDNLLEPATAACLAEAEGGESTPANRVAQSA